MMVFSASICALLEFVSIVVAQRVLRQSFLFLSPILGRQLSL